MLFEESIQFIFLILCFLNKKALADALIIKFLINFSKYFIASLLKISYYYFKLVFFLFAVYKAFFFTNFVPSIVQLLLTFHYSFN